MLADALIATECDDRRSDTGELRLVAAVLECALADARRGDDDAIAWLSNHDVAPFDDTGFSFVYVCDALGADPGWVRSQARLQIRRRGRRTLRPPRMLRAA